VGGTPGRIDLYVGKDVVQKNIPMADAPEALIQLIKVGQLVPAPLVRPARQGAQPDPF
jgi:hypothetical protein